MTIYRVANQTFTNARAAARFAKATNNELRARHVAELAGELLWLADVYEIHLVLAGGDEVRIDIGERLGGRLADRRRQVVAAVRVRGRCVRHVPGEGGGGHGGDG